MHHHHEQVFFRRYPDERNPQQRALREIKRGGVYPAGFFMRARRALLSRQTGEVDHRNIQLLFRFDDLLGQPFRIGPENRAQRFMPHYQRLKTRTQRFNIQLARQTQSAAQVIRRAQWLQLP